VTTDMRGKPLRAGDKIAYASSSRGQVLGELKYDAESIISCDLARWKDVFST
jgi:hypothetical protein